MSANSNTFVTELSKLFAACIIENLSVDEEKMP